MISDIKANKKQTSIGIGLLGMGVVGGGVLNVLLQKSDELAAKIGRPIELMGVLVKDPSKSRRPDLPAGLLTIDPTAILSNPDVHIVVEAIGGRDAARDYVQRAIASGKHVVTANKELMAWLGPELLSLAAERGVQVRYEASVAAGTPVLGPLARDLAANEVLGIRGIVNGTTNYILTQMEAGGVGYDAALRQAQDLGYAESDPTDDVEGFDAAYKLSILSSLAWGVHVDPGRVYREGISALEARDFVYAGQAGYTIKLLATARKIGDALEVRVHPALVPDTAPISRVGGALNAIEVETDLAGQVFFQGPGAGALPTASALVADLIDVARGVAAGTAGPTWTRPGNGLVVRPIDELETLYYLRLAVTDGAGLLDQISEIMARSGIILDSVTREDTGALGRRTDLVLITRRARESSMRLALRLLDDLDIVHRLAMLRVEEW